MDFFKSLKNFFLKFNDPEQINKQLGELIKR